ncbi:MAG TPA: sulfatase, partial [Planctomycetota bacterium]
MIHRILHGISVGAALCGVVGLFECGLVLAGQPYHRDPALWSTALPLDLLAGAALGAAAALLLPLLSRSAEREAYPGMQLACIAAALLATLVVGWQAHTVWIAPRVGPLAPLGLLATLIAFAAGGATLLGARRAATSGLGWRIGSFFAPPSLVALLGLLAMSAPAAHLLPVAGAPLAPAPGAVPPANAPNILLVVLDTVRADRLGCYGHFRATSPALDQLAADGVVFEQAFSAAPWTLPSHASIFTGLHPATHGTGWEYLRLGDTAGGAREAGVTQRHFRTLAEEFGEMGWDTCGLSQKGWLNARTGLTRGFRNYHDFASPPPRERLLARRIWSRLVGTQPVLAPDKGAARLVDRALEWLDDGRGRAGGRPFFLFLNLNEAHAPYWPPVAERSAFLPAGLDLAAAQALLPFQTPEARKEFECGLRPPQPRESELLQALYDAEIRYQDAQLGRLVAQLEETGQLEETLVVVTADHGEEFGEFGRLGHQFALSDALLHVPMVMRFPRRLPAGRRVSSLASTVDIYPTLLDFVAGECGVRSPVAAEQQPLEGVSLLPVFTEGAPPPRDVVLADYANPSWYLALYPCRGEAGGFAAGLGRSIAMLRTLDDKFLAFGDGAERHVDLRRDPDESGASTTDDYESAVRSGVLRDRMFELRNAYRARWLALSDPLRGSAAIRDLGDLAAAGYVDAPASKRTSSVPPPPAPVLEPPR